MYDLAKSFEIRLFNRPLISVGSPEARSGAFDEMLQQRWITDIFGKNSSTGRRVTEANASQVSAVWACMQLLSNTTAVVPLSVYRRTKTGREIFNSHPTYRLLHSRPNQLMNSFTWRRSTMMQMAGNGNSYTLIDRNQFSGKPKSFRLISSPNHVQPFMYDGMIWYNVRDIKDPVKAEDMLHFKWNTSDGLVGKSPITIARENIAQAIVMQEYASKIYASGGSKRMSLKSPGKLDENKKDSFRKTFEQKYAGVENLQKLMILEGGMEMEEVGMSPDDAQFIETFKFKIEEIARIFGTPLHLIQHLEKATNNNIEHQSMDFVTHTMMPHFVNIEQEIDFKLYENEPDVYSKFNVNSLLRADAKTRAIWYRAMADLGVFTINDMLRFEDMNPADDGDERHIQVNRMPLKKMNDMTNDQVVRMLAEAISKRSNGKGSFTDIILENQQQ